MPRIRIRAQDMGKDIKRRLRAIEASIPRNMEAAADEAKEFMQKGKNTPKGVTGELRKGWEVSRTSTGAELLNDAPHAGIVEKGARPHKVNEEGMKALTQWVFRKFFGRSFKIGSGRGVRRRGNAEETKLNRRRKQLREAKGIAYAIAQKIEREGQAPRFFVKKRMGKFGKMLKLHIEKSIRVQAGKRFR